MTRSIRSIRAIACAAALASPCAALAGNSCTVGTITGVSFGSYSPLSTTPLDATGSIGWRCSGNGTMQIGLSAGNAPRSSRRGMSSGSSVLVYDLYTDAARTTIWGDATSGAYPIFPVQGLTNQSTIVYGRVFAQQDVSAGTYSDTIVVTFTF